MSSASPGKYVDKKCPFTGNVSIRGRILSGVVKTTKMKRTIVIRRDYLHYISKYNRFEKRHSTLPAHCSPAFLVREGQKVVVGQCRYVFCLDYHPPLPSYPCRYVCAASRIMQSHRFLLYLVLFIHCMLKSVDLVLAVRCPRRSASTSSRSTPRAVPARSNSRVSKSHGCVI